MMIPKATKGVVVHRRTPWSSKYGVSLCAWRVNWKPRLPELVSYIGSSACDTKLEASSYGANDPFAVGARCFICMCCVLLSLDYLGMLLIFSHI